MVGTVLVAALITYASSPLKTSSPIKANGEQNFNTAYNLVTHGSWSRAESGDKCWPTMKREPLPIMITAGWLMIHPDFDKAYTTQDVTNGGSQLTARAKQVNLLWLFFTIDRGVHRAECGLLTETRSARRALWQRSCEPHQQAEHMAEPTSNAT
jgi:hypothetical protein